mgnify:FL=1
MTESIEKRIFQELSELLGVPVRLDNGAEGQPVQAAFDLTAIISKILSLAVYVGSPVHANFPMLLNQVHADVEYWKRRIKQDELDALPPAAGEPPPAIVDPVEATQPPAEIDPPTEAPPAGV